MSLSEVRFEPKMPTASPPSVAAPGLGAGGHHPPVVGTPRPFYSHRIVTLADNQDWCVGCGSEPRPEVECRPGTPRCDSCEQHPADYVDFGYRVCSSCWSGGRR